MGKEELMEENETGGKHDPKSRLKKMRAWEQQQQKIALALAGKETRRSLSVEGEMGQCTVGLIFLS